MLLVVDSNLVDSETGEIVAEDIIEVIEVEEL